MDLQFIITTQLSAGKHRPITTLNYSMTYNLQQNSKENYIKEYRAAPSIIHRIIEEL